MVKTSVQEKNRDCSCQSGGASPDRGQGGGQGGRGLTLVAEDELARSRRIMDSLETVKIARHEDNRESSVTREEPRGSCNSFASHTKENAPTCS